MPALTCFVKADLRRSFSLSSTGLATEKWPLGVFASIDAGLGVKLEVAHELGVPTIQLHAPAKETRTAENAKRFLERLATMGIRITAVFGGFEGESYADIPTVVTASGWFRPPRAQARLVEMKEIADFARLLGVDVVGLHIGFVPHDTSDPLYQQVIAVTRDLCDHCRGNSRGTIGDWPGAGRHAVAIH